jgi:mRNA-degrading endonuclease RelE of RelBE toxin-antitoxin system
MTLRPDSQKEVLLQLEALEKNPLQGGIKKIEGKKNIFRGRSGDFRYYFRLLPKSNSIEVLLFDIRGSIKQKKIQKL